MPANKENSRDPGASLALLWGEGDSRPRRGPKPKFTPAQVALGGVEIADAEGLESLSMQRVAELLGVTTMALYRYVPGKPDLIDLMVDTVLSDPPDLDRVPGGWRPRLEAWARACRHVYRAHPWILTATAYGATRWARTRWPGWMRRWPPSNRQGSAPATATTPPSSS